MITTIKNPILRILLDHYLAVRADRRMPSRRDIDATRLGRLLPIIWVADYEPEAKTFRYRLAGEEVNKVFGRSLAGRLLTDFVSGDRLAMIDRQFSRVLRDEAALIASGPIYRGDERIIVGERLALPLASYGEKADGLIGATTRDRLVDYDRISMSEQQTAFVSVDDLGPIDIKRAVGD